MTIVHRRSRYADPSWPSVPEPDTSDPRRTFLRHFEEVPRRGWIGKFVVGLADEGYTDPDALIVEAGYRLERFSNEAQARGDKALRGRHYDDLQIFGCEQDEAIEYAGWAIEWAAQPIDVRRRRSAERAPEFRSPISPGARWTAPQRRFLSELGYVGPGLSRTEASLVIDRLLRARSAKRGRR